MDITVKRMYYYLKALSGEYNIFLREEICSPMLRATQLEMSFTSEEDAEAFVRTCNEDAVETIVTA